jgi:hypothetical protein
MLAINETMNAENRYISPQPKDRPTSYDEFSEDRDYACFSKNSFSLNAGDVAIVRARIRLQNADSIIKKARADLGLEPVKHGEFNRIESHDAATACLRES